MRGYFGLISSCNNATGPVIVAGDPYPSNCATLAIDSNRMNVIVGYEISSNNFGGTYLADENTWNPISSSSNQNVAIVAYPYNRTLLVNDSWL